MPVIANPLLNAVYQPIGRLLEASVAVCTAGDEDSLANLEVVVDELSIALRHGFEAVQDPASGLVDTTKIEAGFLVHALVVIADFLDLISSLLHDMHGIEWGSHLFSSRDFRFVRYRRLPIAEFHPDGLRILVGPKCDDLLHLAHVLATELRFPPIVALRTVGEELCRVTGSVAVVRGASPWDLDTITVSQASRDLTLAEHTAVDEAEVRSRVEKGKLYGIKDWSGRLVLPRFQFSRGLDPKFEQLLREADLDNCSWTVCLWLNANSGQELGWFTNQLTRRTKWKPAWDCDGHNDFVAEVPHAAEVSRSEIMFRIASGENTPVYFANHPDYSTAPLGSVHPGGRFDLDPTALRGTAYFALSPTGACKETLEREPAVSLHQLISKQIWSMTPYSKVERLLDFSHKSVDMSASSCRHETQQLATEVATARRGTAFQYNGLVVGLRWDAAEQGIALFGEPGARLPSAVGLGVWSVSQENLLGNDEAWRYVSERSQRIDFPVYFHRFPTEVTIN